MNQKLGGGLYRYGPECTSTFLWCAPLRSCLPRSAEQEKFVRSRRQEICIDAVRADDARALRKKRANHCGRPGPRGPHLSPQKRPGKVIARRRGISQDLRNRIPPLRKCIQRHAAGGDYQGKECRRKRSHTLRASHPERKDHQHCRPGSQCDRDPRWAWHPERAWQIRLATRSITNATNSSTTLKPQSEISTVMSRSNFSPSASDQPNEQSRSDTHGTPFGEPARRQSRQQPVASHRIRQPRIAESERVENAQAPSKRPDQRQRQRIAHEILRASTHAPVVSGAMPANQTAATGSR